MSESGPDSARDVLPARVYWVTAILAVAFMLLLWALTARFHLPAG